MYYRLSVSIIEIRGLPWIGGVSGLMLEVGIPPKSQWIAIPEGHGPRVTVNVSKNNRLTLEIQGSYFNSYCILFISKFLM